MIAGVYIRVSTEEQKTKYSLPSQKKECTKRAKELGADEILYFIDDGYSGAFMDRPGLNELRDAVKQNKINTFICYDPDRFHRKLVNQLIVTEEIEKSGALIEFIDSDYKDTPEGKLFYSIRGAFSEYEREKIRERTNRGKKAKAEAGKIILNNHPYGYNWDKQNSTYIINEKEAELIKNIFAWYTEGIPGIGKLGAAQIAERLAMYQVPTKTKANGWSKNTIRQILSNEIYTGIAYAFKTYKTKVGPKKVKQGKRPKEEWIPIPVPAIIDQATFNKAQAQKAINKTTSARNTRKPYLFRGLVECPECGRKMHVQHVKGKPYYYCPTGKSSDTKTIGEKEKPCGKRTIPLTYFENILFDYLLNLIENPKLIKELQTQNTSKEKVNTHSLLKKLKKQEEKLKIEKEKIMKLYRQDLISDDDVEKELKSIKDEMIKVNQERNRIEALNVEHPPLIDRLSVLNEELTFEEKRTVILDCIEKIIAKRTDTKWAMCGFEPEIDMQVIFKF